MITKALFVTVFTLISLVSFFVDLPPGTMVTDWLNISSIEFTLITNNLLNGFFFGGIIGTIIFFLNRDRLAKKPRYKSYSRKGISYLDKDIEQLLNGSDLIEIEGIGKKRAEDLSFAGVKSVSDLSKRSPKHLARKTGIPLRTISKWIVNANEIIKNK